MCRDCSDVSAAETLVLVGCSYAVCLDVHGGAAGGGVRLKEVSLLSHPGPRKSP